MLTNTYLLSLQAGTSPFVIHLSQHDKGEVLVFKLINRATSTDISSIASAEINGRKPNGKGFTKAVTYSYSSGVGTATVTLTEDMTDAAGNVVCEITLIKGSGSSEKRLGTANFILEVEDAANPNSQFDLLPATPTIYYYNYDGSELLHSETVLSGSDGAYAGTPTRNADNQYTYAFAGWNWNPNSTAGDSTATKNVIRNRNVYAAYSTVVVKYTVTFKNSDNTVLQTISNVPYGDTVSFSGTMPTYPDGDPQDVAFTGFSPSGESITGDTICIAQYSPMTKNERLINDSWATIFASEDNGTYISKYSIGNLKKIQIGNYMYNAQIAAINGDELSDNTGRAKITWILKELYCETHSMNTTKTNTNGWASTNMRSWLSSTVYNLFPSDVKQRMKQVKKTYYNETTNTTLSVDDKIWIPSYSEIHGNDSYHAETSGVVYGIFDTEASLQKIPINNTTPEYNQSYSSDIYDWWLRTSSYDSSGEDFRFIFYYAPFQNSSGFANLSFGVCIGFCT